MLCGIPVTVKRFSVILFDLAWCLVSLSLVDHELLTVEQAAGKLQMHPDTVRRLLREGQIAGVKVGKRQWRVAREALERFIKGDQKPKSEAEA